MKNIIIIFFLSVTLVKAQVSSYTTATTNINITITPAGIHGKTNGTADTTVVAMGDKANAFLLNSPNVIRNNNTMLGIKALNNVIRGHDNLAVGNNAQLQNNYASFSTAIGVQALGRIGGEADFGTATGYWALAVSGRGKSVAYGFKSLFNNRNGEFNSAIGANALYSHTTTHNNTAIGTNALYSNTIGADNTGIGFSAMYSNAFGSWNTAIGVETLIQSSSIAYSVAIGSYVLDSATSSPFNTGIGASVFVRSKTGQSNVAVGYEAIYAGNTSRNNLAIGAYALRACNDCESNTAIGTEALTKNFTASSSTAIGYRALYNFAPVGHFTESSTAIGSMALYNQTSGTSNMAIGSMALYSNTTGAFNTAAGTLALSSNIGTVAGFNLAVGLKSLVSNTTGTNNTATGVEALRNNTTGVENTASGINSLRNNIVGPLNVGIGVNALYNYSDAGSNNVAVGKNAGYTLSAGSNNIFLGSSADVSATGTFNNAIAIGANAIVNASNKVRIGDANVTIIEGQVPWSNPSDRGLKENILYTNRLGLDFINQLKTVSYHYKADKTQTRIDGFIAQDIESTMQNSNVSFSGLKKSSDDGFYSLTYTDFVMPLVNAKKEQDKKINDLESQIIELEKENEKLLQKLSIIADLKAKINQLEK